MTKRSEAMSSSPKHKAARMPEHYRPMEVTFRLEVQSIRANCAMNSPCLSIDHPDYCPVLMTDLVVVEMVKTHTDARVQVWRSEGCYRNLDIMGF